MMNIQDLKIKFIVPRLPLHKSDSTINSCDASSAVLTMANLTPKNHTLILEDKSEHPIRFYDKPDVVVVSVKACSICQAKSIGIRYKEKGCIVIFSDMQTGINPFDLQFYCDSICMDGAELLWPEIINDAANNTLKQRYVLASSRIHFTAPSITNNKHEHPIGYLYPIESIELQRKSVYKTKPKLSLCLNDESINLPH